MGIGLACFLIHAEERRDRHETARIAADEGGAGDLPRWHADRADQLAPRTPGVDPRPAPAGIPDRALSVGYRAIDAARHLVAVDGEHRFIYGQACFRVAGHAIQ